MATKPLRGGLLAAKRPRSPDRSQRDLVTPEPKLREMGTLTKEASGTPHFLRQSKIEINAKFEEINWQEKLRLAHGRTDPQSQWTQDSRAEVRLRNRYIGVQPWDNSRIRLKVREGDLDYINASPISLKDTISNVETKYIATQGPKRAGLSDFWQMIWHETTDVAVIVMLTPTEEAGREKCFQYFPLDMASSPFQIKAVGPEDDPSEGEVAFVEQSHDHGPNTHVRRLKLTIGLETKTVWHLLFTAFPDFGVPEAQDREELLRLLDLSAQKNSHALNPRTIHCSAGVGRSGTFIALDYLQAQIRTGDLAAVAADQDPIYDIVQRLREQRMMMVQSDVQYQFLYDVVLEEFLKQQAARKSADADAQPSPKFRKTSEGFKNNMLDEATQSTDSFQTAPVELDPL